MADKAAAAVLDFSDVKDRGELGITKKRMPRGDYLARVKAVEDRPTKESKEAQWMYVIHLENVRGAGYPYYCKLQANQLWKIRNLFLACGVAIPKKKVRLDPNKIVNKLLGITLEDDEYDNKKQSIITELFPASELQEGETGTDEDEDEEEEDAEDLPEDEAEDEAEEEPEEEEEDEEEEEEPAPAPRRRAAAPAKKTAARAKIPGQRKAEPKVTDDELEELDLEDI